jgi:glycosyl hydrolase family 59 (putative galactocerebrosidase)
MQAPRQTVTPFKLCTFMELNPMKLLHFTPARRILAVAIASAIACVGSAGLTQTGAIMIAIDKMTPGAEPAGFEFARTGQGRPAKWAVTPDTSAAGGLAIEQTSTDTTDYRFPLAIYRPASAGNVDVTVRFKAVAGKVDQAGGIAIRLSDPDNYYVVRANALEDNVRFYRMVKGRREQIEGANTRVTANEWHQLGLRAEGERFTVTFDGKQLFTATDRTFAGAGTVALWTKADSVTRFEGFEIQTLP